MPRLRSCQACPLYSSLVIVIDTILPDIFLCWRVRFAQHRHGVGRGLGFASNTGEDNTAGGRCALGRVDDGAPGEQCESIAMQSGYKRCVAAIFMKRDLGLALSLSPRALHLILATGTQKRRNWRGVQAPMVCHCPPPRSRGHSHRSPTICTKARHGPMEQLQTFGDLQQQKAKENRAQFMRCLP